MRPNKELIQEQEGRDSDTTVFILQLGHQETVMRKHEKSLHHSNNILYRKTSEMTSCPPSLQSFLRVLRSACWRRSFFNVIPLVVRVSINFPGEDMVLETHDKVRHENEDQENPEQTL